MTFWKNEEAEKGKVVLKRFKRSSNGDISSTLSSNKIDLGDSMKGGEEDDESVDYELDENGDMIKKSGMHWIVTAFCVVGNQAGGGIVALPSAVIESQFYFGIVLVTIMGFGLGFTGYCIGQCWVLLQRMYPEYRKHCRRPYAEIGFRAMGPIVKSIVSVFIWANLFGTAVVFLLLASKNIHDFMKAFFSGFNVSFCIIVLFVALFLLPLTFLKSPEDFWWTVVASTIATCSAVVLIVIGTLRDYDTCEPHRTMPDFKVTNYFLAFATLTFAYAGHSSFPTLQHDMKRPTEFRKSNALGFAIVVAMYIPVCVVGYLSYGDSLRDSVINSIQTKWIQQTINVTITLHLILSLTIVFNPLNQEIEEYFTIPHEFGIKRVIIRLSVMVAIVFVGESVPSFGPLLDLVGGALQPFTAIMFPMLFYAYLLTKEQLKKESIANGMEEWEGVPSVKQVLRLCPRWMVIASFLILVIGFSGAAAATYSAILELSTTSFEKPCYLGSSSANEEGHTNCCGHDQNISRYNDISRCSDPDYDYYK